MLVQHHASILHLLVHVQQCVLQYFISIPSSPATQMALQMQAHIPITFKLFFFP